MKEFEVTITETLEKKITVEALSKGEAEQAVRDMWNDADIILDADDFIDVSFNTDDGQELSAVNDTAHTAKQPVRIPKRMNNGRQVCIAIVFGAPTVETIRQAVFSERLMCSHTTIPAMTAVPTAVI